MDPVLQKVWIWAMRYVLPAIGVVNLWQLRGLKRKNDWHNIGTLLLVTMFQGLCCASFLMTGSGVPVVLGYAGLAVTQWSALLVQVLRRKMDFSLESLAFFLCSVGLGAVAMVKPGELVKQTAAVALGVVAYLLLRWVQEEEKRAKLGAILTILVGPGLLVATLIFGEDVYGARNWLYLGPLSIQPAEICKISLVCGALCLSSLWALGGYTAGIIALLLMMNDLGTAVIFAAGFLTAAYLRHGWKMTMGSLAVLGLGLASAGRMAPHVLGRLSTWRHIWEQPFTGGFQQTRGLMCIASGGLFGLGVGAGKMDRFFSADSDMVFATLGESWGLLLALIPLVGLLMMLGFAARRGSDASCVAAVMLCVQGAMNVLGLVDVLPMTGVPLPFVSNGGSAMVAAWGLLAFIKRERETEYGKPEKSADPAGSGDPGGRGILFR